MENFVKNAQIIMENSDQGLHMSKQQADENLQTAKNVHHILSTQHEQVMAMQGPSLDKNISRDDRADYEPEL
ncbi:MAG: hypothetical protein ACI9TY_000803 [Alphaproteobacteria bacterium]|jgi:hypothetical protein